MATETVMEAVVVSGMNPMLVPGLAVLGIIVIVGVLKWLADKGGLEPGLISKMAAVVSVLLGAAAVYGVDLTPVVIVLLPFAPPGLFSVGKALIKKR